MTNIDCIENQIPVNLTESSFRIVTDRMKEATNSLYHTSKEKYDLKARLIEEADDMTTKEKLDALDQNYNRHNQEVWQDIVIFGILSLSIIGIAAGNPSIVKNIRRLVA